MSPKPPAQALKAATADSTLLQSLPPHGLDYTPGACDRLLTVIGQAAVLVKLGLVEREVVTGFLKMAAKQLTDEQVVTAVRYFETELLPKLAPFVYYGEAND